MNLGISTGDRFLFLAGPVHGTFTVVDDPRADPIALKAVDDGTIKHLKRLDLATMQANGRAIRTLKKGQVIRSLTAGEIKAFHKPPPTEKISENELRAWEIRKRDIKRASRLLFYVRAFDESPVSKSDHELKDFILGVVAEAEAAGFDGIPSASSIRKAIAKGELGYRTLALYLRKTGGCRSKTKFPAFVYDSGMEMVAHYYSGPLVKYVDAYEKFDEIFFAKLSEWEKTEQARDWLLVKCNDNSKAKVWNRKPPLERTLSNWINEARDRSTLTLKYGTREANRRLRGRGASFEPVAPGESIVLDQTLAPIWAIEKVDVDGSVAHVLKRPWIVWAIDLYSRMCLGFVITFDPPCLSTLMACFRHVISPKVEWIARFGEYKGATDGFTALHNVILDNAKAHIGRSVKLVGDVAGFRVIYAPIYTPEFKAWIERFNRTMNGALRTMPGAIAESDDPDTAEYDARAAANLSVDSIQVLMAHHIMKYHLRVHDGIGMAPAQKWKEGLEEFDRQTIDDARTFKLLLGTYASGTISGEGVRYNGHRFHDQGLTTLLLNDFSRSNKPGRKGKAGQSDRYPIHFLQQEDTAAISVLNEERGEVVDLPNWDVLHREKPVTWAFSKGEQAYHRAKNKEFHTREEAAIGRQEYEKELAAELAKSNHADGKRIIRVLRGKEKLELGAGMQVLDLKATATIDGMEKPKAIPMGVSLKERVDPVTTVKGRPPRPSGGRPNKLKAEPLPEVAPLAKEDVFKVVDVEDDDDAMLDKLARKFGY